MKVKSCYPLKAFDSLDDALDHARKIKNGGGSHADSEIEVHWNKKAKRTAPLGGPKSAGIAAYGIEPEEGAEDLAKEFIVVIVNEDVVPGGKTCAECDETHFADDYLCPECRENL